MSDVLLVGLAGAVLVFSLALALETRAQRAKLAELPAPETPPPLYPRIDTTACICAGACITACPEGDVIALVDGRPQLVGASACIGHGDCVRSCPVAAIELVLGSRDRAALVPRASSTFETTLAGLYVAGEVTGIALIHNAVAQGVQVAASALATTGPYDGDVDLAIIGAGPAGIAAALEAQRRGARCVVFEKGGFGGAMRSYPRQKVVMTAPLDLPGIGRVALRRTTKEALLELFESVVARARLPIVEHAEVTGIARTRTGLRVDTTAGTATARRVVLAIGRRGVPRKLAVPGDDLPHVVHAVADPAAHAGKRIVVVGGGDSAVELALALRAHRGTRVMLVHRGHDFGRAKPANQRALARAAARGRLLVHTDTRVHGVTPAYVVVAGPGFTGTLPADLVVCCLGAELPARWLRGMGVELRELRGEPLTRRAGRS